MNEKKRFMLLKSTISIAEFWTIIKNILADLEISKIFYNSYFNDYLYYNSYCY